jgi:hypothetical protein
MTPDEARAYIAVFRKHTVPGTDYVHTSSGRDIRLDDMTDEDALFVAKGFQFMEAEAAKRNNRRRQ